MMARRATPNQAAPLLGQSDNRQDFETAFLRHVHRLLQLSYESLTPGDYRRAEEDDITGDLRKHMRYLTEEAPTERWMTKYSVQEQDPVDDIRSASTGELRRGKRRPKIDVRIVCKQRIPNPSYVIEAKRLYRSDSVAEYFGEDGVGMFLTGQYAPRDERAGMMGYVQSETVGQWAQRLQEKLSSLSSLVTVSGEPFTPVPFRGGPRGCFMSEHRRDDGRPIRLVHVTFHFAS